MMPGAGEQIPSLAFARCLQGLGLEAGEISALLAAEGYSRGRLEQARERLYTSAAPEAVGLGTFAFGSLGRLEASTQSDLDLVVLYDSELVDVARAQAYRAQVIGALGSSFDIPEKTFDRAVDVRALTRNVGGRDDSNLSLTYRALLLTEGAWLDHAGPCREMKRAVFRAYADAEISRGRFLTSLGNDLHRYYRTLCMDYRYKVEELDKGWAIRVVKLRHSRKLWHLANIALQCWAVDAIAEDDARDAMLASRIGWPSLLRLYGALEHFGAPELARELFCAFDQFLAIMSTQAARTELGELVYEAREGAPIYRELRENAARLDVATAEVIELLMRRARGFLVRFCIL